jgi:hypothetical protein
MNIPNYSNGIKGNEMDFKTDLCKKFWQGSNDVGTNDCVAS